jgi:hypothetical protein
MAAKQNNRDSDRESQKPYTSQPPQHMDPSKPPKTREEKKAERPKSQAKTHKYADIEKDKKGKPKQLGESATEIDDETTV